MNDVSSRSKSRTSSHPFKSFAATCKRKWRKAGVPAKVGVVFGGIVAVICVMALVMGLIRMVQWHVEVTNAQKRQEELVQKYDFDPGNIISDAQFFNPDAMSQAEVQAFIIKHGPNCTSPNCLPVKTFDTTDIAANNLCKAYKGAKGESASAIIYKSSQACGVSEKVLLTVMQKEQHLIGSANPTDFQYKAAMGLSCPDDADCDPQYAGFFNQVYGSAKRFKYYQAHKSQYGYHVGTLNYVQYHPNKSCGGTQIYIRNQATALLYVYTPYQPNSASLAAGMGEGDSCSSYGNRNFALIYNNWFGDPRK
ncbi:hemagglutinin [Bifidobacterium sp. ESL0682]|uniref:hemagglutinin n=1 Tax=Bifidobacterium sp. ESL0682 TaxID=2983212 RepID=UPI0023F6600A|nr:hemagglutinin [Bifidobacterium sp. ESL0682]WEV41584.1 hemagglutinin [Bifidobacterium sp. ESL0682]